MWKCKVMHFGSQNGNTDYFFCTEKVQTTSEESDLGVIVSEELKVSKKCIKVVNTADRILLLLLLHPFNGRQDFRND